MQKLLAGEIILSDLIKCNLYEINELYKKRKLEELAILEIEQADRLAQIETDLIEF